MRMPIPARVPHAGTPPRAISELKPTLSNLTPGTPTTVGEILYAKVETAEALAKLAAAALEKKKALEAAAKKKEAAAKAPQRRRAAHLPSS